MSYRRLDPQKIIDTTDQLRRRIEERFPSSGLGRVARELLGLAGQAAERSRRIQQPNWVLRGTALALGIAFVVALVMNFRSIQLRDEQPTVSDVIQDIDALVASAVFIGASVVFLLSLDNRLKRRRVLGALHELRSMAHIVDMHQLTKDPEIVAGDKQPTASSPSRSLTPFELARYLDYSSEMLSLLSKIAALYTQGFEDSEAMAAVDDIESLTSGLSQKIWQKIMILDRIVGQVGPGKPDGA